MYTIDLTSCKCTKAPPNKFILFRTDKQPILDREQGIEVTVPNEHSGPWIKSFDEVGTNVANDFEHIRKPPAPPSASKPRVPHRKSGNSSPLGDPSWMIGENVKTYMKIVHTSLFDSTPKYIILLLVQKTLNFVQDDLQTLIYTQNPTEADQWKLVDPNPFEKEQRAKMEATLKATQEALECLNQMRI